MDGPWTRVHPYHAVCSDQVGSHVAMFYLVLVLFAVGAILMLGLSSITSEDGNAPTTTVDPAVVQACNEALADEIAAIGQTTTTGPDSRRATSTTDTFELPSTGPTCNEVWDGG